MILTFCQAEKPIKSNSTNPSDPGSKDNPQGGFVVLPASFDGLNDYFEENFTITGL